MEGTARKSWRPGRWTITAGIAMIAIGLLSFNAFAVFTATATGTHGTTTGDMELTIGALDANTSLSVASAKIAPGDTITRTVKLTVSNDTNTMSGMALTTSGTLNSGSATLYSDATYGLKLWIEKCSVAYTTNYPTTPNTASCGGVATDVLGTSGSPVAFVQTSASMAGITTTNGAVNYLKVVITFPGGSGGAQDTAQDAMEGTDATLNFQFDGTQRNGSAH